MDKWDIAHMQVADTYAQLSHARRSKVGAVIVKDNRIISIGYNGMPSGWDNCCENEISDGTHIGNGKEKTVLKTRPEVIHAESNAITKVAKSSESCEDATMYSTMEPCLDCAKLIYQAGIRKVYYRDTYPKSNGGIEFLTKCKVVVKKSS